MTTSQISCPQCGNHFAVQNSSINRAAKSNAPLHCGRKCAGLARRKHKSAEQKKAEKSSYDRLRRERLGEVLLQKKRAAYQLEVTQNTTALRARQKVHRTKRRAAHSEYCRQPEYRKWKAEYDRRYRAERFYGPFSEAFLVLREIENDLSQRASKYQRSLANGTLNKCQRRKREYEQCTHSS